MWMSADMTKHLHDSLQCSICFQKAVLQGRECTSQSCCITDAVVHTVWTHVIGPLHCRAMLSDKLLSKTDYNCDREIRTLELLKLRFGDANLHNCEVRNGALPPCTVTTLSCYCGNLSTTHYT